MENLQVFLGANSAHGFVNYMYDRSVAKAGYHTYLIKGGPGTGKSTFMKRVAEHAEQKGQTVIRALCSSDPASLDGVILPEKKIMVLDATAPHTVEPLYPGVSETILDFGRFWDPARLRENGAKIMAVQDTYAGVMYKAGRLIRAMGRTVDDSRQLALGGLDLAALTTRTQTLAKVWFKNQSGVGREQVFFLSALTAAGPLWLTDTTRALARHTVLLSDPYGAAADVMLSLLRDRALNAGCRVLCVKDPLRPQSSIEQLIIPELSLAFMRDHKLFKTQFPGRRVRLGRYYEKDRMASHSRRLRFDKRLFEELQKLCRVNLAKSRVLHDTLESYYRQAMDYPALDAAAREWMARIFG